MKRLICLLLAGALGLAALCGCADKAGTPGSSETMYAAESADVFAKPELSSEKVGTLEPGDAVEVCEALDTGWYRIKFKDGEYFVNSNSLSKNAPSGEGNVWITTWSTAVMPPDGEDKIPSNPKLEGNTVRQQIRTSAGGEKLRLVISNEYGETDLEIEALTVARLPEPSDYSVDVESLVPLTLNGEGSFSVPAGESVTTDGLEFTFSALEDLAITMKLGSVPQTLTCHTASRCYAWVTEGDRSADNGYEKHQRMVSWYFIQRLETEAKEDRFTVVTLGDSLTDGASIPDNSFARYSDELARLMADDENLSGCGVAAMGIGATSFYTFNAPIDGSKRVERDILNVPGAKYLILMMGTNDIGYAWNDVSDGLIDGYKTLIKKCHESGIKVIAMTIPPNKGSGHYSADKEKMRKKVNEFILSEDSGFDGYIDISSVMASSDDPEKMDAKYLSAWNDWLHFNPDGYKKIGQTVYEYLSEFVKEN